MSAAHGNMLHPAELTRLVAQARQLPPAERQEFAVHLQQELAAAFASGDQATAAQIMQMLNAIAPGDALAPNAAGRNDALAPISAPR